MRDDEMIAWTSLCISNLKALLQHNKRWRGSGQSPLKDFARLCFGRQKQRVWRPRAAFVRTGALENTENGPLADGVAPLICSQAPRAVTFWWGHSFYTKTLNLRIRHLRRMGDTNIWREKDSIVEKGLNFQQFIQHENILS